MAKSKKLVNAADLHKQKQMYKLMERYTRVIKDCPWSLSFSWNIGYVTGTDIADIQYQEFTCCTNNIIFASMLFEATMLPVMINIAYMEFNQLVIL